MVCADLPPEMETVSFLEAHFIVLAKNQGFHDHASMVIGPPL